MDVWLDPRIEGLKPTVRSEKARNQPSAASNLLKSDGLKWDEDRLQQMFMYESVQAIIVIPLYVVPREDQIVWLEDRNWSRQYIG